MPTEMERPDDRLPVDRVNPAKDGDDTVHGKIKKPKKSELLKEEDG